MNAIIILAIVAPIALRAAQVIVAAMIIKMRGVKAQDKLKAILKLFS